MSRKKGGDQYWWVLEGATEALRGALRWWYVADVGVLADGVRWSQRVEDATRFKTRRGATTWATAARIADRVNAVQVGNIYERGADEPR